MIIPNGTITPKLKTGGGIDPKTGHAIPVIIKYGSGIPCQYSASRHDWQAQKNGEPVTQQSYTVLIEEQEFNFEQVALFNSGGRCVGDFSVRQIEPLEAVGQLRIYL